MKSATFGDSGDEQRLSKHCRARVFDLSDQWVEAQGSAGGTTVDNLVEPPRPALTKLVLGREIDYVGQPSRA